MRADSIALPILFARDQWGRGRSYRPNIKAISTQGVGGGVGEGRVRVWGHWIPQDFVGGGAIDSAGFARLARRAGVRWIANSPYTRDVLREKLAVDAPIVRPVFGCSRFRSVARREAGGVLFASLNRHKGVDTVLSLADARRDIPFVIVDTWTADRAGRLRTVRSLADRSNVTLRRGRPDLGDVYAGTRLLLMPSRGYETWGRMVTEAQSCGIPVLASRSGNLADTVGPGGVCLDRDAPFEEWLGAFSRILDDESLYRELSASALAWSARPEIDEDVVVAGLEALLAPVRRAVSP